MIKIDNILLVANELIKKKYPDLKLKKWQVEYVVAAIIGLNELEKKGEDEMIFNEKTHKVIIESMNEVEAKAFIIFLESEALRHEDDVRDIVTLIDQVKKRFKF